MKNDIPLPLVFLLSFATMIICSVAVTSERVHAVVGEALLQNPVVLF